MTMNRSQWLGMLCLLATISGYACDDDNNGHHRTGLGPSGISFSPFAVEPSVGALGGVSTHGVTLRPELAVPEVATTGGCPARQPFQVPFAVVASGAGRSDLSIHEVQMRFVDRTGVSTGVTTIVGPELTARFGSTLLPAVGTRSFPFVLPFGCTGLAVGRIGVVVVTGDSRDVVGRTSLGIDVVPRP